MKKILALAVASTILFSGCSLTKMGKGVISVNGEIITQAEFDKAVDKEIDGSMLSLIHI